MAYTVGKPYFIICLTKKEFQDYCKKMAKEMHDKGLPFMLRDCRWTHNKSITRGHNRVTGVLIGEWYDIPDIEDIIHDMMLRSNNYSVLRKCLTILENRV